MDSSKTEKRNHMDSSKTEKSKPVVFCKECENVRYKMENNRIIQYTIPCRHEEEHYIIHVNGIPHIYNSELFCFIKL